MIIEKISRIEKFSSNSYFYSIILDDLYYSSDIERLLKENDIKEKVLGNSLDEIYEYESNCEWFVKFDKNNELLFKLKYGHLVK